MKKRVYVAPSSVVVQMKIELLLGGLVVSGVNHDGGDGKEPIIPVNPDPDDPVEPPMPGKEWSFDDDDNGGVGNWGSF